MKLQSDFLMYFFLKRTVVGFLCLFIAGLLCQDCNYDSYWSLAEVALIFGIISSALYCCSIVTRLKPFFQKIAFFSFFTNIFVILILWKLIPGFHLESTSTAIWMAFLIGIMFFGIQFISIFKRLRTTKKIPKIKTAKARVVSSKKNSLY